MSELTQKQCTPCEGTVAPLSKDEAASYMKQVPQWTLAEDACSIERTFTFNGFQGAMFAVNGVAALAEKEGHHPDLHIAFNTVRISISTHAIGGLSENDFILAAKIDELMQ